MRNRSLRIVVCVLAIGFMASAAHADMIYSFSGVATNGASIGFQLSSPSVPAGVYGPSQLFSCVGACGIATFAGPLLSYISTSGIGAYFFFDNIGGPGTYSANWLLSTGKGTLVVSVPEPTTLLFGFLSLAILGFVAFKRNSRMQLNRC